MGDSTRLTPAEIRLTRSALGKAVRGNQEAEIQLAGAIADAYRKGRENSAALGEVVRLREFLIRVDMLPPGASVLDAKAIAREALRG